MEAVIIWSDKDALPLLKTFRKLGRLLLTFVNYRFVRKGICETTERQNKGILFIPHRVPLTNIFAFFKRFNFEVIFQEHICHVKLHCSNPFTRKSLQNLSGKYRRKKTIPQQLFH